MKCFCVDRGCRCTLRFFGLGCAGGRFARLHVCGLQALIAANRFVFINTPGFGDFAVADRSSCAGSDITRRRSVATSDTPACVVNYSRPPSESRGAE